MNRLNVYLLARNQTIKNKQKKNDLFVFNSVGVSRVMLIDRNGNT